MNNAYLEAVRLLLKVAPYIFESNVFALKGGTAINLFLKNMPRLSVDLDLVFLDHRLSRHQALASIKQSLNVLEEQLSGDGLICEQGRNREGNEVKLFVTQGMTREVVELNSLERVRQQLFSKLPGALSEKQVNFLLSIARAEPEWDLMQCGYLRELPAIQWKLQNLERLKYKNRSKFEQQATQLRALLK